VSLSHNRPRGFWRCGTRSPSQRDALDAVVAHVEHRGPAAAEHISYVEGLHFVKPVAAPRDADVDELAERRRRPRAP